MTRVSHPYLGVAIATAIVISPLALIQEGVCGEPRASEARQVASAGMTQSDWSAPVDGIRGRLIVTPSAKGQFKLELELQNIDPGAGPIEIWWNPNTHNLNLSVVDETGKPLRKSGAAISRIMIGSFWLPLMRQSSVKVAVVGDPYTTNSSGDILLVISDDDWLFSQGPSGPARLFIGGSVESVPKKERESGGQVWRGTLNLPRVEIPILRK